MTAIIILSFLGVLLTGLITLLSRHRRIVTRHNFVAEYREQFILLADEYFGTYDGLNRRGRLNQEVYTRLVKQVNLIQSYLGHHGVLDYIGPGHQIHVPRYQVIINTLPKFRLNSVDTFDVNTSDDCLLRYLGSQEQTVTVLRGKLKNPFIWLQVGFQQVFSFPFYLLNWFGVIDDNRTQKLTRNVLFKILSGIGGLVAFLSGLVTIIQGKEATAELIRKIWPW